MGVRRKANGKWAAYLDWTDTNGVRRQPQATFDTKRAALAWERQRRIDLDNGGRLLADRDKTLRNFIGEWMESRTVTKLSSNTLKRDGPILRHDFPDLMDLKLQDVSTRKVNQALTALRKRGRRPRQAGDPTEGEALSEASIQRSRSTLARVFEDAVDDELVANNPRHQKLRRWSCAVIRAISITLATQARPLTRPTAHASASKTERPECQTASAPNMMLRAAN